MKRESIIFTIVKIVRSQALLIIIINLIILTPTLALEPSTVATSSPELQVKLKALQNEIASKASQLKQEISKKLQNKAFVGFVKSKSTNSLTIATNTGTRIININEYTEFSGGTKTKKFNLNSLETDNYLVALGDIDESEVLTAKKIIKLDPEEVKRKVVFGTVTTLGEQTLTIKTVDGQKFNFSTGSKTIYQLEKAKAGFDDIKLNKPIIVVGTESESSVPKARFIYILPYSPNIQPEKEGGPSTNSGQTPSVTSKVKKQI